MKKNKSDEEFLKMRHPKFNDKKERTSVDLSKDVDLEIAKEALGVEKSSVNLKSISGIFFLIFGFITIILGVTGAIDFEFEVSELTGHLINCSPGVILACFGMIILITSKPKIKIK